jgi:transketolase
MACGMAFEGRKVYTYAISPFVTLRPYEQVKLDVCAHELPIVNLGVGAGYSYDIMGPTHHTVEDIACMRVLPSLVIHSPADGVTAVALSRMSYEDARPQYIRFDRAGIPDLYKGWDVDFRDGMIVAREGKDVCIIATGIMVHQALKVARMLEEKGIKAGVIDLFRLKPINKDLLFQHLQGVRSVVTLEEHRLAGGMGSAIAEIFIDEGVTIPTLRIGQGDRFVFDNGGRQAIWERYGLSVESVTSRILQVLTFGRNPQTVRTV